MRFSVSLGGLSVVLTAAVYMAAAYPAVRRWQQINIQSLSEISCSSTGCDTSAYTTDWSLTGSDYIIDSETHYFLSVPSQAELTARFPALEFSDVGFIARFQQPTTYSTLDGEVWRLYSRTVQARSHTIAIMVGYAQKAPWKMLATDSDSEIAVVDQKLRTEADDIARNLPSIQNPTKSRAIQKLSADGFESVSLGFTSLEELTR